MTKNIKPISLAIAALAILSGCNKEVKPADSIELSAAEVNVPRIGYLSDGSQITVNVTSNTFWMAFIPEDIDWLEVNPKGAPAGDTEVTISVTSNIDGALRKGLISFESLSGCSSALSVIQSGTESAPRVSATLSGHTWNSDDTMDILTTREVIPFYYSGDSFTSAYDLPEAGKYAAVYPSGKSAVFDGENVSVSLPAKQDYAPGKEINPDMAYAGTSSDGNFTLTPIFSTLRVNMKGKGSPVSISLKAGNATTVLNISEEVSLSATPMPFDIVAPGYDGPITVGITDASGEEEPFEFADVNLTVGSITEVPVSFESSSMFVDLNMPSFYGESGAEKVYSNCYMISKPGDYKFAAADMAGNAIQCAAVKWVWATTGVWNSSASCVLEDLITNLTFERGSVRFSVPEDFTPGNVILGAVDENGIVKYLWHIWTTEEPADINVGGVIWMDRNIGASYKFDPTDPEKCNAARGFFYNWGCKNPIAGLYEGNKDDANGDGFTQGKGSTYYIFNNEVANTGEWGSMENYPAGWTGSISDYAAFPMSSFDNTTYAPTTNQKINWPDDANPCPHGYTIMTLAQAEALGTLETMTTICDGENNLKNVASVRSGVIFPSCGYRAASTSKITISGNPDGRYWANSSNTAAKRDYWLTNRSNCKVNYAGIGPGMSVRCVRTTK